jgi:DNA-binding HxlR family transcriptional regulator
MKQHLREMVEMGLIGVENPDDDDPIYWLTEKGKALATPIGGAE